MTRAVFTHGTLLRRENYDVVITGDGLSGLDMAHRWKPDLILLFYLDELLKERATWIMPQADAHRFTIRLHHSQACPFKGDTFRMGQVFTILMENALRYGRDGGHLDVTLHYANGQYYLEFRDDGPGVSSQFLPEMFNRFSREEQSRARHSGGSGLGLSIASAICQAHGGSISASLPETGGLAVTILLPSTSSKMENSRS